MQETLKLCKEFINKNAFKYQKPQSDTDYSISTVSVRSQLLLPTASACVPSVPSVWIQFLIHVLYLDAQSIWNLRSEAGVYLSLSLCLMNTLSAPELEAGSQQLPWLVGAKFHCVDSPMDQLNHSSP